MKKFFVMLLSVLMAFVMSFSFVACGNDRTNGDNSNNTGGDNTGSGGDNTGSGGDNTGSSGDNTGSGEETVNVAEKIAAAFDNLYTVNGFTGEIKVTTSVATDAESTETDVTSLEKRGDRIKLVVTLPEDDKTEGSESSGAIASDASIAAPKTQEYIFDLATGYLYKAGETNYTFTQPVPQGAFDYAFALVEANKPTTPAAPAFGGSYDKNTKTATDSIDISADANKLLKPLYDSYEGGSLIDLIDTYIDAYVADPSIQDLNDAIDKFEFFVTTGKDSPVGAWIDLLKTTYNIDLFEELKGFGVTFTEDQIKALRARTVGEMAIGLCDYADATVQAIIDLIASSGSQGNPSQPAALAAEEDGSGDGSGDGSTTGGGLDPAQLMEMVGMIKEIATQQVGLLVQSAFFKEIPAEMYTDDGKGNKVIDGDKLKARLAATIDPLTEMLGTVKVKTLIDMIPVEEVRFMVVNKVSITELKCTYSLTFDNDYNIDKLTIDFDFSHGYTEATPAAEDDTAGDETPQTPYWFANNGFKTKIEVSLGSYSSAETTFDVALAPDLPAKSVSAIISDAPTADVTVLLETSLTALPKAKVEVILVKAEGDPVDITPAEGDIVLDDAKKTMTVKASFITDALTTAEPGEFIVISLYYDAQGESIDVMLLPLPTDPEKAGPAVENMVKMVAGFIDKMTGGSDNGSGDTGDVGGSDSGTDIGSDNVESLAA